MMRGSASADIFELFLNSRIVELEKALGDKLTQCQLVDGRLQGFEQIRDKATECAKPGYSVQVDHWAKEDARLVESLRVEINTISGCIKAFRRALESYHPFISSCDNQNALIEAQVKKLSDKIEKDFINNKQGAKYASQHGRKYETAC